MKLSDESKKMFFLACYNIDKFKEFVFKSSFLERYEFSDETIKEIKEDDIKLLQFGFEWLKASFFQTGQEKFKIKEPKRLFCYKKFYFINFTISIFK